MKNDLEEEKIPDEEPMGFDKVGLAKNASWKYPEDSKPKECGDIKKMI